MEWAEHNNPENKKCAMSAMEAFFEQVGHISHTLTPSRLPPHSQVSVLMVEKAAVEGETLYAVFKELMKRLRGIIDSQASSKRQLSVAIRGYGHFAAVSIHIYTHITYHTHHIYTHITYHTHYTCFETVPCFVPCTHMYTQPCKVFLKPADLQFMFQEMANRSEQLFFSPVGAVEDNLFQLPAFLEALAAIVKEIGEVLYIM